MRGLAKNVWLLAVAVAVAVGAAEEESNASMCSGTTMGEDREKQLFQS